MCIIFQSPFLKMRCILKIIQLVVLRKGFLIHCEEIESFVFKMDDSL